MADIKTEIQSIRDFVASELPGATFKLQNMPDKYKAAELAIELVRSTTNTETASSYRIAQTYQLVYFGTSQLDCLTKMQLVERRMNDKQIIPLGSTARYLRIGSFSLSQSFKTETNGVFSVIGMLEAEIRESRTQIAYESVNNLEVGTYTDKTAGAWSTLDGTETPNNLNDGYQWTDIEAGTTVQGEVASPDGFTWSDIESGKTVFKEEDE